MKIKLVCALLIMMSIVNAQEPVYIDTYNVGYIFNDSLQTKIRMNYPKGDSIWDLFIDKKNSVFLFQNAINKGYSRFQIKNQKTFDKTHFTYWAVQGKDLKCILNLYTDEEYSTFEVIYGIMRQQYRRKLK